MKELLSVLEQGRNLFYAFEITLCLGLWLISSIGLLSMRALDGVLNIDLEHDADLSPDMDTDLSLWDSFLGFMGVGKVPFTIVFTLFLFSHGTLGIVLNESLFSWLTPSSGGFSYLLQGISFAGATVGASLSTALITRPLRPLFKDYGKEASADSLVGKEASVNTSSVTSSFGQATVRLNNGNVVEISVRAIQDDRPIAYGEKVLIIDFIPEKNIYLVDKTSSFTL